MYSPNYYAQINSLGKDEMYADAFLNDSVYLISDGNFDVLMAYLNKEYGCNKAVKVDNIGKDVFVWKFEKMNIINGFQDDEGLKYYMENGNIRTGFIRAKDDIYYAWPLGKQGPIRKDKNGNRIHGGGSLAASGSYKINGRWYFFDDEYKMVKGR